MVSTYVQLLNVLLIIFTMLFNVIVLTVFTITGSAVSFLVTETVKRKTSSKTIKRFSENAKMITTLISLFVVNSAFAAGSQCSMTEVKSLLEGCDRLRGLNMTSAGGTIVNDHNCDILLPKQVFNDEPLFQYALADSKKFYTIIMVDPDAPPQVEGEFYLHMLKSNIPGLALKAKESSKTVGIDYRAYKSPAPPRGTGPHRYACLLYEQADGNNFIPNVPSSRFRFGLAKWLLGKNLCGPVAGIQFRTEF